MLLEMASVKDGSETLTLEGREEKQNAPLHKCPRCDSTNTKFCYYNNYSRLQPRHFCRVCRRYWTEGGTLRSVPIGGNRKNKRRKITPDANSPVIVTAGNPVPEVGRAALEGAIFADMFYPVLHSPSAPPPSIYSINEFFDAPLPDTSLTFMEDSGGKSLGFVWSGGITASASSCSSSSHYTGGCEDGPLGLMAASTKSTWGKEETVLPASYWDFWHDAADFTDVGDGQTGLPL